MKYREFYSRLLYIANQEKSSTIIENDTYHDSADVYERIFLSCSEEVYILARGIKNQIFDFNHVGSAALKFLQKENSKLNIILREKNSTDYDAAVNSAFLRGLQNELPSQGKINISFYKGGDNWLDNIGSTTVGDDRIYRNRYFQTEYKSNSNANVCFNDIEACKSFRDSISECLKDQSINKTFTH